MRSYLNDPPPASARNWPGVLGFGNKTGARLKIMRHIEFGKDGVWRQPPPPTRPDGTPVPPVSRQAGHASHTVPHTAREQWQAASAQATTPPGTVQRTGDPLRTLQGQLDNVLHRAAPRPLFDFGMGLNFDMDTAQLKPVLRVKVQDWLSLQAVPQPTLKLQKRWTVPQTRLCMRLVYDCPLQELDHFWEPPARLMLRVDNLAGTGIHFGPSGVEFDERLQIAGGGRETALRCAASVAFPRRLPIEEGQPLLDWRVERLGIKARW